MSYFRAAGLVAALVLTFLIAVPLQLLARRFSWPLRFWLQVWFSRIVCAIIGLRIDALGPLPGEHPRFVVANHVSWTDVLALSCLYPFVFLAKSEVARWPLLGTLAWLQDTIFVDRGNRRAIPQVNAALVAAMRQGRDVVVFAEGTSTDGSGVLKFNASHFALLCELEADSAKAVLFTLAPVAIAYSEAASRHGAPGIPVDVGWYGDMEFVPHLWDLMKRGGATCHIVFGDAVQLAGRDRKTLAAATEASVRALLQATRPDDPASLKNLK